MQPPRATEPVSARGRPLKVRELLQPLWNLSMLLMLALTGCFVLQQIVIVGMEKPYDAYLGLSGYGMKSGHLWELFTYQFLHAGKLQFALNLGGLWYFGRAVEGWFGSRK